MTTHHCTCMSLASLIGMAIVMMVPMLLPSLVPTLSRIVAPGDHHRRSEKGEGRSCKIDASPQ